MVSDEIKKKYLPTIGLEIHFEPKTKHKMFCNCLNDPDEKIPNKNVCPICLAHPGVLPTINKEAIELILKLGIALNCEIPRVARFDRKNYFYPDLPKSYQITQAFHPFCLNGKLIPFLEEELSEVLIREIHLEEDTGRLSHIKDKTLIDYNRASRPLIELVTKACIHDGRTARVFAESLQIILRNLNISDADMEKGQMRVEVNVSVSQNDQWGTKTEVKNINSFKAAEKAIDYEINRQIELIEKGEKVIQETRG
jgi:aspartyl-tRNA(Asn)/glutamyl-tRNA(Gln) amidotransferase subunit B